MNIQPQSGLGDLLFSMPLIYELSKREHVNIATNHSYAIPETKEFKNISITTVDYAIGMIPKIKEGFTHLRYDRYVNHYFDTYYAPFTERPISESINEVRAIFTDRIKNIKSCLPERYAVYAPPRAAKRHLQKSDGEKYICAPDPVYTESVLKTYDMPLIIVGRDDVYAPWVKMPENGIDVRNLLSFWELCEYIARSSFVITQISAITTLAGLFERPTHALKSSNETDTEHDKHISGVVWPGQQIIK